MTFGESDQSKKKNGLLRYVIWFLILLTILVLLGDRHWVLELFTHYRPHLALVSLVVATLCVFSERYTGGFVALGLAVFHALVLGVHWVPHNDAFASVQSTPSTSLRAIAVNVGSNNERLDLVSRMIKDEQPELVALTEVSQQRIVELADVSASYHVAVNTETPGYGVGLFSKNPIKIAHTIDLGGHPYPALVASVVVDDTVVNVIVMRPPPPILKQWAQAQRDQFYALKALVADLTGPTVVLGDFNSTPWSPTFRQLLAGSGLRDANIGFSYAPTWPAGAGILALPIDHCLVSSGISVRDFRRGATVGSDHLPVIADLAL